MAQSILVVVGADAASFEQGGVGTSVYRAFLLLGAASPILMPMMMNAQKPRKDIEEKLDEALSETFPASDPVAVGRNDHPGKPARPRPEKPEKAG